MKWNQYITMKLIWTVLITVMVAGASGCRNEKEEIINEAAKLQIPVAVYDAFVSKYSIDIAKKAGWSQIGKKLWEGRFIQGNDDLSELFTDVGAYIQDSGRLIRGTDMPQTAYQFIKTNSPSFNIRQIYIGDTAGASSGYRVLLVAGDNSSVKIARFDSTGKFIREDIIG